MAKTTSQFYSGELASWSDIEYLADWSALLLGNGMSINMWPPFAYRSLYDVERLGARDAAVFDALETENFEEVLSHLDRSISVVSALGDDPEKLEHRRTSIAKALGRAVSAVHVPYTSIPTASLRKIRESLRTFSWVFTTSYDLIAYYAAACDDFQGFRDGFWTEGRFNHDVLAHAGADTKLLWLHGALHLVVLESGETRKRKKGLWSLQEQFRQGFKGDKSARPLIITEGKSTQKLEAIERNAYLSHVLNELRWCDEPMVIFGHGLAADQDQHLIEAIDRHSTRPLAISIRAGARRENFRMKHELHARFPDREIHFFDAATHPLGSPDLLISERAEDPMAA